MDEIMSMSANAINVMRSAYKFPQEVECLSQESFNAIVKAVEHYHGIGDQTKGVKCHGDACCAGQKPCPTPNACGVGK